MYVKKSTLHINHCKLGMFWCYIFLNIYTYIVMIIIQFTILKLTKLYVYYNININRSLYIIHTLRPSPLTLITNLNSPLLHSSFLNVSSFLFITASLFYSGAFGCLQGEPCAGTQPPPVSLRFHSAI